jgi:hypothetical protein
MHLLINLWANAADYADASDSSRPLQPGRNERGPGRSGREKVRRKGRQYGQNWRAIISRRTDDETLVGRCYAIVGLSGSTEGNTTPTS